ncbi:MAG: TM2 domain-containing protein [Clostridiales bacterium]|nr:TM2 domain-containing protein [Clostridiales bacterium]
MFCKNCANQLDPNATFCSRCGTPKDQGNAYCSNCAAPTLPGAVACSNCGAPVNVQQAAPQQAFGQQAQGGPYPSQPKSKMAAGLLGIFLGAWGVHNFYLGYTNKAILQIVLTVVSCGAIGLWGFIEGIMILAGSINTDANGVPLVD